MFSFRLHEIWEGVQSIPWFGCTHLIADKIGCGRANSFTGIGKRASARPVVFSCLDTSISAEWKCK